MAREAIWFWPRLFLQWLRMRLHHADPVHLHCPFYIYSYELASPILMRGWLFALIVGLAIIPSAVFAQGITSPVITAPTAGQILQGQVSITGTTDMANFASAELDFAYASDSTGSWFLIQTFSQPVANSAIAIWDTTSISDGDYILRLRVTLEDGSTQDATVKVTVQNQAPHPTSAATITQAVTFTPALVSQPSTPVVGVVPPTPISPPIFSTPTSLPSNPVEVQTTEIYAGIQRGALVILGLFIVFAVLIRLRRS
jgi:hypothetical protein